LTFSDGLFWLIFTVASGSRLHTPECRNYLSTADDLQGSWSEPVFLNASGNDPSLFHDRDGRKWLVNTDQVNIPPMRRHAGTLLQEYSPAEKRLIGPVRNIFQGTDFGCPEGSKLHLHGDYYYLIVAEGGTGYGHAMTVVRSKDIWGPYEVHPDNPVLTARDQPDNPIQRAGHGDIVNVDEDQIAVVYLASRPVKQRSLLGRETFLAKASWGIDGWFRLESRTPQLALPDFGLPEQKAEMEPYRDDFDSATLSLRWNTLRRPFKDLIDLKSRSGWLHLRPTPSFLDSIEDVSLIAQRIRHHQFSAETLMLYRPLEKQQIAGLTCYYDTRRFYWLTRQWSPSAGHCIALYAKGPQIATDLRAAASIENEEIVRLGVQCDGYSLQFKYALGESGEWQLIGAPQDALILTDEYVEDVDPIRWFGFTGAFVGLAGYDIGGRGPTPAFDWFDYRGIGGIPAIG
jgi:xylan 1,4-beta-xylosidase